MKEETRLVGFTRLQLVDVGDGRVIGDSGWKRNQVVNLGFQDFIVGAVGAIAGSKQVSYMAIGTGTAPAVDGTTLEGETGVRITTANTAIASKTMQSTCQFLGADMAGTCTIQNVALVNTSSGGTILCGTTYATFFKSGVELLVTAIKKLVEVGEHLKKVLETIPSQANIILEGVTNGRQALQVELKGHSELYGDIQNGAEMSSSLLRFIKNKSNKIAQWALRLWRRAMVTLFKAPVKFGEHLKRVLETIPSQPLILGKCVETGQRALLKRVEGTVRTIQRCIELGRNDLIVVIGQCNKIANQNVNATFFNWCVERVVIFVKKLHKLRETLIETIRSQAKYILEGSETIIGASDQVMLRMVG